MYKNFFSTCFAFLFWGIIVCMMLALAWHNQPSIIDDFCFGWVGRDFGILRGAYLYYTNWSGRYFANILLHLNPLVFSTNFALFKWTPILLLVIGFLTTLWTFKNLFQYSFKSNQLWTLTFLFQSICLYIIPGIYQLFYWFTGIYYYLSFNLVLLFFNLILFKPKTKINTALLFLLLFAIVGTSEITMLVFSSLFLFYLIQKWNNNQFDKSLILFCIAWLLFIGMVLFAPGNFVRSGGGNNNLNYIFQKFPLIFYQIFKSFFDQKMIYLWAFIVFNISKSLPKLNTPITNIHWGWLLIFILGAYFASILALTLGLHEQGIPERIISLFSLYSLFFTTLFAFFVGQSERTKLIFNFTRNWTLPAIILLFLLVKINPNFKTLTYEFWENRQLKFAQENNLRFKSIKESPNRKVAVPRIKFTNSMFYTGELSNDSTNLWCKCLSKYYQKDAVYLDE